MEVDSMINMEELALKVLSEVKLSSFKQACERAGLNEELSELLVDYLDSRVRGE